MIMLINDFILREIKTYIRHSPPTTIPIVLVRSHWPHNAKLAFVKIFQAEFGFFNICDKNLFASTC